MPAPAYDIIILEEKSLECAWYLAETAHRTMLDVIDTFTCDPEWKYIFNALDGTNKILVDLEDIRRALSNIIFKTKYNM